MKNQFVKFNVIPGQMVHSTSEFGFRHNCAFCGKPAFHRFQASKGHTHKIWLCTAHMIQFFHLKPNRMAPTPKAVYTPMPECMPREYALTRLLQEPLKFFGKKLVCHDSGDIMGVRYFFTLYDALKCADQGEEGFQLSVTGVLSFSTKAKKKLAINYVRPVQLGGLDGALKDAIEHFTSPNRCHPSNALALRLVLEPAATEFYNEVLGLKDQILAELEATANG